MHIVTGLVFAALLGKSREGNALAPLETLTSGPIRVAHALQGRIRFVVPSLRGSASELRAAIERLGSLDGIERVDGSPVSGSLVIFYRPELIDPPLLLGAVARVLGLEGELDRTPTPALTRELHLLAESLNRAVYERSHGVLDLWSVMALVLLVTGGRKIVHDGWRALPEGGTLLWWALQSLHVKGRVEP